VLSIIGVDRSPDYGYYVGQAHAENAHRSSSRALLSKARNIPIGRHRDLELLIAVLDFQNPHGPKHLHMTGSGKNTHTANVLDPCLS
jgi:hypothetical protein